MKTIITLRSLSLIALLAGFTFLAGCNAASLTGPEQPEPVQQTGGDGNGGGNGGDSHGETEPRNI